MNKLSTISILIALFIFSCKKDEVEKQTDLGFNYFPTEIGTWVEYQVDSIVWNDFYSKDDPQFLDTFVFQIREVIDSNFTDNIGREAQRIVRYKRLNDTLDWEVKDVWYQVKTSTGAEKVEENIRLIKLAFPVRNETTWNGNAFNTQPQWDHEYENIDDPLMVGNLSFDSTVVVNQVDEVSLISRTYGIEKYARNVGMIFREFINVKTNPVNQEITSGLKYKFIAIDWGKN